MNIDRRTVLQGIGGSLLAGPLSFLPRLAQAANAGNQYQAIVCVFLTGGNDGNNTVIPLDATNFGYYQTYRSSVALNEANGQSPPIPLTGTTMGLHPALVNTAKLWTGGQVGMVLNIGTLIDQNLTVASYDANPNGPDVPQNLFSHEDQRNEWKSLVYQGSGTTGWGGRLSEHFTASGNGVVPPMLSIAGPDLFTLGSSEPLCLPATGPFLLKPYLGKYANQVGAAVESLYSAQQAPYVNASVTAVQDLVTAGVGASVQLNPVLTGSNPTIDPLFENLTSDVASQLWQVAKVIADQSNLGAQTQIFFVEYGNFDTHHDELEVQGELLADFDAAVYAFYSATAALGLGPNVTTFTMSDFNRTYIPNTTDGTDHAWGSHMFVIGGSVIPQAIVGSLPALYAPGSQKSGQVGPLDVGTEGRWLPQIAVDQYAATLANWLGLSYAQITPNVVPGLGNYPNPFLKLLNPLGPGTAARRFR